MAVLRAARSGWPSSSGDEAQAQPGRDRRHDIAPVKRGATRPAARYSRLVDADDLRRRLDVAKRLNRPLSGAMKCCVPIWA